MKQMIRKAQPPRSLIHIDGPLTNISVAYAQDEMNFIAPRFAPIVRVNKQSDKYFIWNKAQLRRTDAKKRGPGAKAAKTGLNVGNASYFCDVWALGHDVPWQDRDNADNPLDLDRDAAMLITQHMLIQRDVRCAADLFADSIWTGSSTGSDVTPSPTWDDATSTPIDDIADETEAILEKTGRKPNTLVLGYSAYKRLRNHEDLLDRVKYTQRGVVTTDLMAALFDVDQVIVAMASYNTAAEELTEAADFIFNQLDAVLLYVNPTPSVNAPSACYTFVWDYTRNGQGISMERYEERSSKCTVIEGEMNFDFAQVGADLGMKFDGAVAS